MSLNGISTLPTKAERRLAKLELAKAKRTAQGKSNRYYDLNMLPSESNTGLQPGRPWTSDPAANIPDAEAWVKMDGWYNVPGDPNSGGPGGQTWRLMAPAGTLNDKPTYAYADETVSWNGTEWQYTNVTYGVLAVGQGGYRPWLATWSGTFTASKVASPL